MLRKLDLRDRGSTDKTGHFGPQRFAIGGLVDFDDGIGHTQLVQNRFGFDTERSFDKT